MSTTPSAPLFSKRHYEKIAAVLEDLGYDLSPAAHLAAVARFSTMLADDNPAFNKAKFSDASGVD